MKIFQIMLVLTLFAFAAGARESRRVCRDSLGQTVGTKTVIGRMAIYRDATERTCGTKR